MAGYVKLFGTIVNSSIWGEDDKTRIVWITMLAIADRYGVVDASVYGLSRQANVSEVDCEKALKILLSPDPRSRTKDNEGRRIQEIEGGWHILNYGIYKDKFTFEQRKAYKAKWARDNKKPKKFQLVKKVPPPPGQATYLALEKNGESVKVLDQACDPGRTLDFTPKQKHEPKTNGDFE